MKEVLRTTDFRRLNLLSFLHANREHPTPFEDLAEMFNVTTRTIRQDLDFLHDHYSDFGTVEHTTEGIILTLSKRGNNTLVKQNYLLSTNYIKILLYILEQGTTSLEDIATTFYISVSSASRIINQLSKRLVEKFDVSISHSPIELHGDERHIRFIWAQHLYEIEALLDWEGLGVEDELLDSCIWDIIEAMEVSVNIIAFSSAKILTYVGFQRYQQGNLVDETVLNTDFYLDQLFQAFDYDTEKIQAFKDEISHIFNVPYSDELIGQLFYVYLQKNFSLNYEHLIEMDKQNLSNKRLQLDIGGMLYRLSHEFKIDLPNKFDLLLEIHNSIRLFNIDLGSNYLYVRRNHYACKHLQQLIPEFYERAEGLLQELVSSLEMKRLDDPNYMEYLMYILLINWHDLLPQLLEKSSQLKFLIINHHNTRHSEVLKELFQFYFRKSIHFDSLEYPELRWQAINLDDYYAILTTKNVIDLETTTPIIHMNDIPTKEEFNRIRAEISNLLPNSINRL
ncbi:hypothetical protein B8A33_06565 [Dolosigranulum pigrum]|uniref:helix-turn-helix domain-containing protein n=1 Tax=Dolosigranulum pigrum TaxID=29394 RepID=UPI000DBFCB17|nr:helix-turn-helix domain-containing protein [Dolosigranulum pigrum]RAN55900.1 hypothetical protein B8A33_06565 [Dolosigranulum pigrum]